MINFRKKNDTIQQALDSLEQAHQDKQEELRRQSIQATYVRDFMSSPTWKSVLMPITKLQDIWAASEGLFKNFSYRAQKEARENPWGIILKAAIGGFALGFIAAYYFNHKKRAHR